MNKKYLFLIGILFVFMWLQFVSAIDVPDCTVNLDAPGYYELTDDISSTADCLLITSNDVELDCKGHSISYGGNGANGGEGVKAILGTVYLSNITVKNCIIQDTNAGGTTGYGITFTRVSNSQIYNNTIQTNGTSANYGIYMYIGSENNLIENNTINALGTTTTNYGIYLREQANNNIVKNNNITGKGTATSHPIYVYGSDNNTIEDNYLSGYSTYLDNTDSNIYDVLLSTGSKHNTVRNNYLFIQAPEDNFGIYITGNSNYNQAYNNTIQVNGTAIGTGNHGIYILGSDFNEILNNTIYTNGYSTMYGIRLGTGASQNLIKNNFINTYGTGASNYGVFLQYVINNNLTENTIYTNGLTTNHGVSLSGSSENNIDGNYISTYGTATSTTTANHGIYLTASITNNILNNRIFTNGTTSGTPSAANGNIGIDLYSNSGYNYVYNNTIQTDGKAQNWGMYLYISNQNTILNNQISTNGELTANQGIFLSTSSNLNEILYNNISTYGSTTNYGISLTTISNNNQFIGNNIISNGSIGETTTTNNWGITLTTSCYGNLFENNTIQTNGGRYNYGIYSLLNSDSSIFRGNNISTYGDRNNYGIFLSESRNNIAEDNIISTSGSSDINYGIYLYSNARNNLIKGNDISTSGTSTSYGVYLLFLTPTSYPHGNTFQENNFITTAGTEFRVGTAAIDDITLINQNIDSYLFTSTGSTVTVKNSTAGEINFLERLTGSGSGFSNSITISENYAYVDGSIPTLAQPAEITIYNRSTTRTNLGIYKDGVLCSSPDCINLTSMQAGNVTFNVTGWSAYSINGSDEIPQVVSLVAPANNTNITSQEYSFNFSVTDETSNLFKCYLYIDDILYGSNESVSKDIETSISASGITGGSHLWYISCLDEGNWSQSSEVRTIQNLIPSVVYNSPENTTYINNENSVLLNVTLSDTENSLFDVWVYGDGVLINESTGIANGDYTYNWTGLSLGQHNWSVISSDGLSNSTEQVYFFNLINLTLNCEAGGPYQSGALVLVHGNVSNGISVLQNQNISLNVYDSSNNLLANNNVTSDSSGNFQTSFSGLVAGNNTLNSSITYQGINISCVDNIVVGGGALISLDKIISLNNMTDTTISYNISLKVTNLGSSSLTNGYLVDSDSSNSPYSLGTLGAGSSTISSYIKEYTRNSTTYNSTLLIATANGTDSYSGNEILANSSEIILIVPALGIDQQLTLIKNVYYNSENSTSVNYTVSIEVVNSGGEDLTSISVIDTDLDINTNINLNISQSWNYSNSILVDKAASNTNKLFVKSSATANAITYQSNQIQVRIPGYGGPADAIVYAPASVQTSTSLDTIIKILNMNPDIGQDFTIDYWITNEAEDTNYTSGQQTIYVAASGETNLTATLTSPSSAGIYRHRAIVTWAGGTATAYDTFSVTAPSQDVGDTGGSPGGGGGSITGRATEEVVCNPPYIRYGLECCLDANNNTICDRDETPASTQQENKTKEDGTIGEEIPKEESQFLNNIKNVISNIGRFFSLIGKNISENKNYLFVGFGILIVLTVIFGIIALIRAIIKRKPKDATRLKDIMGKEVYAENGDKIGKIKEIYLEKNKVYGWLIKPDKKISRKLRKKKLLIRHKYVKSIGKIMIIEEKVAEHLDKLDSDVR